MKMIHSLLARMPMPVKLGIPLASALLATACSSAAASSPSSAPAAGSSASASTTGTVITTQAGPAGAFLTAGSGRAVYLWAEDGMNMSACSGACAAAWPPVPATGKLTATGMTARPLSPARRFGRKLADWIGGGWTGRGGVSYPRRILSAAAVAAAVIVAGLGGWGLHAATSSPAASPLSSAALLTASHQTAGKVYFYDAGHRWLYMSVNISSASGAVDNGTVICQVEGPDGRLTTVGSFRLSGGYGYWGSPDPVTNGPLTGARLVTTTGTVLATATFPA
jgi:predicted lipoprotein with Yx(FWY)xxD motif